MVFLFFWRFGGVLPLCTSIRAAMYKAGLYCNPNAVLKRYAKSLDGVSCALKFEKLWKKPRETLA